MNSITEAIPVGSTVSKGTIFKRLFVIAYVAAVAVATIGWWSAFAWATVKLAGWIMA